MRLRTPGLLIFLSTLLVFVFSLNGVWSADHPTSLMELAYALWANHSVVLGKVGQFHPQSIDDFVYNGNYYSALAPGVPVLALPFVGLGFVLDGRFTLYGNAMLLSEFFAALCNSVAAYLVFKLGSTYFTKKTSAFVAFAYAFSTISWPFATYFFQSDVSAMLDLFAVCLAVRMARSRSSGLAVAIPCGAALGAALTVDYVNVVFVPIVSLFLLYEFRKDLVGFAKGFAGLLVTSSVGVLVLATYNQAAFGSPFVTTEQAYQHTSSLLGSFSYPLVEGLYLDLFSPLRGVFVYCPILLVGLLGFYFMLRRRENASEGLLFAACFVGILLPYSMWQDAVGGEAFGPRFLIAAIPFLLLPTGFLIESGRRGPCRLRIRALRIGGSLQRHRRGDQGHPAGRGGVTLSLPDAGASLLLRRHPGHLVVETSRPPVVGSCYLNHRHGHCPAACFPSSIAAWRSGPSEGGGRELFVAGAAEFDGHHAEVGDRATGD